MKVEVSLTISLKRSSLHWKRFSVSDFRPSGEKIYLRGVHLVDGDDELPDTEGEGKEGVLAGLAILGNTSLELTGTSGDDEDSAVSL